MTKDGATKAAQALWYTARGKAEIRPETLQPPRPHEVRVRALFGALSKGTEALVLGGRVPRSEFERMRAPFMAGDFPFPVKYGYATVGEIDSGPAEMVGRKVFALYPHQTHFNIPQDAIVPLPAAVAPERAVLAANMAAKSTPRALTADTGASRLAQIRPLCDRNEYTAIGVL